MYKISLMKSAVPIFDIEGMYAAMGNDNRASTCTGVCTVLPIAVGLTKTSISAQHRTSFLRIGRASQQRMMLRCLILNIVKLFVRRSYHLSRWIHLPPPPSLFSDILSPSPDNNDTSHPIILRNFDYDNDVGPYCYD